MKIVMTLLTLMMGISYFVWGKTADPATTTDKHRFQGLKLKGQLKKPDLTYIYKRRGIRTEKILNIPENFHDETVRDSQKL